MDYYHIVITCGVSLFATNNFFGKRTREGNFFGFHGSNPVLPADAEEKPYIEGWVAAMRPAFYEVPGKAEKQVSAEYSLLHALQRSGQLQDNAKITLLYTDTLGGRAAARLLQLLFSDHFHAEVVLKELQGLDVSDRVQLNRALGAYMKKVSDALGWDKYGTCFAPLGGYKVMTSFGYIVGSYHGFPTAYLHEDSQTLQIVPPIPIDINEGFIRQNAPFIRRLMRDVLPFEELTYREQELVRHNPSFFAEEEGYALLNPFGEFIFSQEKYQPPLGTRFLLSETAVKVIGQNASRWLFVSQQLRELVNKLEDEDAHWGELHHDETFKNLKRKSLDFHLYKGASNADRGVFRAAWRYEEQTDTLYVNCVWFDHSVYEKEATEGNGLIGSGQFLDVSDSIYENQKK